MIRVLVFNDDGIFSDGLSALVLGLSDLAEVYVAAPKNQQSAMSHSITLRNPLNIKETDFHGAERAWVVDGTPADCVKFGLQKLKRMGITPDFVISGINDGANCGADVAYSGTVAGAREGAMNGIHSIAVSVGSRTPKHFEYTCDMLPELMELSKELDTSVILNFNAPDKPRWEIKGVKVVSGDNKIFNDSIVKVEDGVYRYDGSIIDFSGSGIDDDISLLYKNYATITPLTYYSTDRKALRYIKRAANSGALCLLMDFQENTMPVMYKCDELTDKIVRFSKAVQAIGLPVVVTQQYTRGSGATIQELKDTFDNFTKIEKLEFNCFDTPGFEDKMEAAIGSEVVLAGIEAHGTVLQTAMGFLERDYKVTVIRDCCSSAGKDDYKAAMELLARKGCTVTTMEAFLFGALGSAGHEAFDEVMEIIRG
jgi:5'/3'-nucleotidase SurE